MQENMTNVGLDLEMLQEFADALYDRSPAIERDVARLRQGGNERELTADLFRAIHNIKGDAALCKFDLGVAIAHPVESLMSRFRDGDIPFTDLLAETILLSIDRLELATDALLHGRSTGNLHLPTLLEYLGGLANAPVDQLDSRCAELVQAVTGFNPSAGGLLAAPAGRAASGQARLNEDLAFFRSLALQLESRSPLFKGRTMRVLRLALETNKVGGSVVDVLQLEAAVYLHDVGMMFLPEAAWLKVGRLTEDDKKLLNSHPGLAAGLLQRMPGWMAAAEMVAQHHEMPDGRGYPQQVRGDAICPGAKILAIIDAFEAVMLKHSDRGKTRSVLRAIAEINACDKQFAPEWIAPFNSVIRKTIEA